MRTRLYAALMLMTLALCAPALAWPARAASAPFFTLSIGGAYLRQQPLLSSPVTTPVFADEQYSVNARTADNTWLKLDSAKGSGWILSLYGKVSGDMSALPAIQTSSQTSAVTPAKGASPAAPPKWITPVTPKAKKLYEAKRPGKDPNAFTVIGDCNSVPEAYLGRLATGLFDAGKHPEFSAIIEKFAPTFTRTSVAAFSGFNSRSMFDPEWANPNYCQSGEGLLACELRLSRASIVFISLGTGDQFTWKDFEQNYRQIVEYAIQNKVLPVLVTKADDLESQQGEAPPGFLNDVVRKLGREYGVPVIDFWAATRNLKDYGMRWEGNENFHMSAEGSDTRILLTLQALGAITR